MNTEAEWKKAIKKAAPGDRTVLLAYADWLEEKGEDLRAFQAREKAGAGTLVYRLTHPNWGGELVGEFARLHHLKQHINLKLLMSSRSSAAMGKYRRAYDDTPVAVEELVVVIEWHAKPTEVARRPYSADLKI
jgi:uncharacterized protein (TIGR02996 family)